MVDRRPFAGFYTIGDAAEELGWSRYDQTRIKRAIKQGEIPVEKLPGDKRWWIRQEDLEAYRYRTAGVRDSAAALERLTALQAEVDQLREELRDAADLERMTAERALSLLSLDECLEILGRIETDGLPTKARYAVYDAERSVQLQLDQRDAPDFVGQRPKGVNKHAKRRTIATGVGPVDIWYWQLRSGKWVAGYGGPRPQWPGARGGIGSAREAIKLAGIQARYQYGKPVRTSSVRLRFAALERCGFACVYCGRKPPDVELHVDHVIPVAKGGSNDLWNLVAACRDCNLGKHARELEQAVGEPVET